MTRLDQRIFSSSHEAYKNYETTTATITVSGTIAAGGTAFTQNFTLDRDGTRADIYYTVGSEKRPMNAGTIEPVYTAAEPDKMNTVIKYSGSNVQVGFFVNNAGAPYTTTTYTYKIEVVQYDAPIATL